MEHSKGLVKNTVNFRITLSGYELNQHKEREEEAVCKRDATTYFRAVRSLHTSEIFNLKELAMISSPDISCPWDNLFVARPLQGLQRSRQARAGQYADLALASKPGATYVHARR